MLDEKSLPKSEPVRFLAKTIFDLKFNQRKRNYTFVAMDELEKSPQVRRFLLSHAVHAIKHPFDGNRELLLPQEFEFIRKIRKQNII